MGINSLRTFHGEGSLHRKGPASLCALPLISFWLETVIIPPSGGTTTQPQPPSMGRPGWAGPLENSGFPFPIQPLTLEEARVVLNPGKRGGMGSFSLYG